MADKTQPMDKELKKALMEPYKEETEVKARIVPYGEKEDKTDKKMKDIMKNMYGF